MTQTRKRNEPIVPNRRSLSDLQISAQCLGGVPVPAEVFSSLLEEQMAVGYFYVRAFVCRSDVCALAGFDLIGRPFGVTGLEHLLIKGFRIRDVWGVSAYGA